MPIGNTGGGGGGGTILANTILGAPGTFDFQALPQGFDDLRIVAIVRGTRASVADTLTMTINNDTTVGHYSYRLANYTTSSALTAADGSATAYFPAHNSMPAASSAANVFGVCEVWIYGYTSATWNKQMLQRDWGNYNGDTARAIDWAGAQWLSTAAVNRVTFAGAVTANLATGSQVRIYGQ